MNDVTQILSRIEAGDPSAVEHLLPLVYEELRTLAAQKRAQEKATFMTQLWPSGNSQWEMVLYMRGVTACLIAAAAFYIPLTPARAWWGYGHETITRGVLQDLNGTGDLQRFIGETNSQFSAIPHVEPAGNHFINIDSTVTTSGNAGTVSYAIDFANFRAHTFTFPTNTTAANSRYGSAYISNYGGVLYTRRQHESDSF